MNFSPTLVLITPGLLQWGLRLKQFDPYFRQGKERGETPRERWGQLVALILCLPLFVLAQDLSNLPQGVHPNKSSNAASRWSVLAEQGPGWLSPQERQSGLSFKSEDLKAQQSDDAINPAFLWVDQGAKMWSEAPTTRTPSCASCHADAATSMKGVALKYPQWNKASQQLVNLEWQINHCRSKRQGMKALNYESDELLALSAWITLASRSMVSEREIDASLAPSFLRGKQLYEQRIGQNNLSCANCHTQHYSQRLGAEIISQGQPHAYPAYRLEWQKMGSLQRRLRACLSGVKAYIFPFGSQELTELELYLSFRGQGLPLESPGVRR